MLSISLFGTFHVALHQRPITSFGATKAQALLAYLCTESSHPHQRDSIAGLLWPDMPAARARHNLSQTLLRLRKGLEEGEQAETYIIADRHTLALNRAANCDIDVAAFQEIYQRQIGNQRDSANRNGPLADAAITAIRSAVALYRDELLSDFSVSDSDLFEDWLIQTRTRLRRQAQHMLRLLTLHFEQTTELAIASGYAARLRELAPFSEEAHRRLIRLLAMQGERNAALMEHERFRAELQAELGVQPETETNHLVAQIQAGDFLTPEHATAVQPGLIAQPDQSNENEKAHSRSAHVMHDWESAPALSVLYGRDRELKELRSKILGDRCRLIGIFAIGGQGKTALAAKLARTLAQDFDVIIWRSLLNAPPLTELLQSWLPALTGRQWMDLPTDHDHRMRLLFQGLRRRRCLLVLDNMESIMVAKGRGGEFRANYQMFEQLIRQFGETDHQSCLLITSREEPVEFTFLNRRSLPVHSLHLGGLTIEAAHSILADKGYQISPTAVKPLNERYSGNPLALLLIADTILELFGGQLSNFLEQDIAIFEDVQEILNQHFSRLTPLEIAILLWLAVEHEPIPYDRLARHLNRSEPQPSLLASLRSLQRRSLVHQQRGRFALQNVVMEYTIDRLIAWATAEIVQKTPNILTRVALMCAQGPVYRRRVQKRLILQPIVEQIARQIGDANVTAHIQNFLPVVRANPHWAMSYTGGNLLNLLLYLNVDCRGFDFSDLALWQVDLQNRPLYEANLAGVDFQDTLFADTLSHILFLNYSLDGKWLAARIGTEELRIWRTSDYHLVSIIPNGLNKVWPVVFHPDGGSLFAGGEGVDIFEWDLQTQQTRKRLLGHTERIWTMALDPNHHRLASAGEDRHIRIWDINSGRCEAILSAHDNIIRCVAFSHDGRMLASVGDDHRVIFWDIARQQPIGKPFELPARTTAVAFHHDGHTVATGSVDGVICVWELPTGSAQNARIVQQLEDHDGTIAALIFHPNRKQLLSGSWDTTCRLWDVEMGATRHVFSGHRREIRTLALHPDGNSLASGGWDNSVHVWEMRTGRLLVRHTGYRRDILGVAFSKDGEILACAGSNSTASLWPLEDRGNQLHIRRQPASIHPAVELLAPYATGEHYGTILSPQSLALSLQYWRLETLERVQLPPHLSQSGQSLAISPDGRFIAQIQHSPSVSLLHMGSGILAARLDGHTEVVRAAAFSPDSSLLATVGDDETIRIWRVPSGECLHALTGHTDSIWTVRFSADGTQLASAGMDTTIMIWQVPNFEPLHRLRGHTNSIFQVCFSPDGAHLASVSEDQTARLWDLVRGEVRHTLSGHTNGVWSVDFHPHRNIVATGGSDETIRLWETDSGQCLYVRSLPGLYEGTNITGATGLTRAQKTALQQLGAIEDS